MNKTELKYTDSDLRRGISGGLSVGMSPTYDIMNSEAEILAIKAIVDKFASAQPSKPLSSLHLDLGVCKGIAELLGETLEEAINDEGCLSLSLSNRTQLSIKIDDGSMALWVYGNYKPIPECGKIWKLLFDAGYKIEG